MRSGPDGTGQYAIRYVLEHEPKVAVEGLVQRDCKSRNRGGREKALRRLARGGLLGVEALVRERRVLEREEVRTVGEAQEVQRPREEG